MSISALSEKLVIIKDSLFDTDRLSDYELWVKIHPKQISLCAFGAGNACGLYVRQQFHTAGSAVTLIARLQSIWQQDGVLLPQSWENVHVVFSNHLFALVPSGVCDQSNSSSVLTLSSSYNPTKHTAFVSEMDKQRAQLVFAGSTELVDWIKESYSNAAIRFSHACGSFTDAVFAEDADKDKGVFVHLQHNTLTVLAVEFGSIKLLNSFSCLSPNDVLYYILLVMEQCGLSPREVPLRIWGVTADDEVMLMVKKYVNFVFLGGKPSSLSFGYEFDSASLTDEIDLLGSVLAL